MVQCRSIGRSSSSDSRCTWSARGAWHTGHTAPRQLTSYPQRARASTSVLSRLRLERSSPRMAVVRSYPRQYEGAIGTTTTLYRRSLLLWASCLRTCLVQLAVLVTAQKHAAEPAGACTVGLGERLCVGPQNLVHPSTICTFPFQQFLFVDHKVWLRVSDAIFGPSFFEEMVTQGLPLCSYIIHLRKSRLYLKPVHTNIG